MTMIKAWSGAENVMFCSLKTILYRPFMGELSIENESVQIMEFIPDDAKAPEVLRVDASTIRMSG